MVNPSTSVTVGKNKENQSWRGKLMTKRKDQIAIVAAAAAADGEEEEENII